MNLISDLDAAPSVARVLLRFDLLDDAAGAGSSDGGVHTLLKLRVPGCACCCTTQHSLPSCLAPCAWQHLVASARLSCSKALRSRARQCTCSDLYAPTSLSHAPAALKLLSDACTGERDSQAAPSSVVQATCLHGIKLEPLQPASLPASAAAHAGACAGGRRGP